MKQLKVLGSGDAFSSGARYCTSFLIGDDSGGALIDCGVTTLLRMKQLGIDANSINTIFVTHFHGDHYGGIPFLILSSTYENKRDTPLTFVGPKGLKNQLIALQDALYPGTSDLFRELDLQFWEYDGSKQTIDEFEYQAFPVKHSPPSMPHGLRLKWEEKTLSYSGDTEWSENLIDLADNSDLFICECNNYNVESPGHLSYRTILSKHYKFNSKRIMLTHMGPAVLEREDLRFEKLEDGTTIDLW
ncbi:MAG: MBL fold metallo-hydrolase [Cyclobacteriaceae bacterium]|nr:MBL fold metallo-hydrolase [Cyclobacteriaceae bacterium HetDA_MAG_MS6]